MTEIVWCAATVQDHEETMRCIRRARVAVSWFEGEGIWTQSFCDTHAVLREEQLIELGLNPTTATMWHKLVDPKERRAV